MGEGDGSQDDPFARDPIMNQPGPTYLVMARAQPHTAECGNFIYPAPRRPAGDGRVRPT